ncbi:MAG: DUF3560 domain-containing protein [Mycolicibacterium sp.]|uniref:DUF3560 domain-containing protein n=1 Tax=Mycolicibacterium sp. TaxID=2320850 RepID=UPI003D0F272D
MAITISHTPSDGTLVHGTARGDGTNVILKTHGFRWFRTLGLWGIPGSRDRQPNMGTITRAADALRSAGHDVTTDIDATHRNVVDAEADRTERSQARAEALAAKAERKSHAADAAWEAERRATDVLPPFGQPILVGHHSEGRHRRAIERARTATRRAIDATDDAARAAQRAQAAANTSAHRYNPVTVKNRIDRLHAEQRKDQRALDGHSRVVARTATHTYRDEFAPATGEYRQQLLDRTDQRASEIAYWESVYAAQQDAGLAASHSRDTITKGDQIKYRSQWYTVVRANTKTVSVRLFEGASFTNTIGYHEISGHRRADTEPSGSPEAI